MKQTIQIPKGGVVTPKLKTIINSKLHISPSRIVTKQQQQQQQQQETRTRTVNNELKEGTYIYVIIIFILFKYIL